MVSPNTASHTDTAFRMEGLVTFFNLFCSLSLVLLVTDYVKDLPVPEFIVVTIGLVTSVVAIRRGLRIIRRDKMRQSADSIDQRELHISVDQVSAKTERNGYHTIVSAMTDRLGSYNAGLIDIGKLQQHIDDCASMYKVSVRRLLVMALMQRLEHALADAALRASAWIIRLGVVRLDFLPAGVTPYCYYRDLWLEDIELMSCPRMRTRFALMRYADAVGIVYDYGFPAGVRDAILSLARRLRLVKSDRL